MKYTTRSHSKLIKYGSSVSGLKGPSVRQLLSLISNLYNSEALGCWPTNTQKLSPTLTNWTFKGAIGKNCPRFF